MEVVCCSPYTLTSFVETSAARLRSLGSENMSVDSGTVAGGFYDVYWKLLKDMA